MKYLFGIIMLIVVLMSRQEKSNSSQFVDVQKSTPREVVIR